MSSKQQQQPFPRDATEDLERTRSDIIIENHGENKMERYDTSLENNTLRTISFVKREREMSELLKKSTDLSRTSSSTIRDVQRISDLDQMQQSRIETEKRRSSESRLQRRRTKRLQRRQLIAEEEDNDENDEKDAEEEECCDSEFRPSLQLRREASQVEILQKKSIWAYRWVACISVVDILTWFVYLFIFATYVQYQVLSSPETEWMLSKQMRSLAGNPKKLSQVTTVDDMWTWMDNDLIDTLAPEKTNIFHQKRLKFLNSTNLTYQSINGYHYISENKIYMRQIRCKKGACQEPNKAGGFFEQAFGGTNQQLEQDGQVLSDYDDDWMWQISNENENENTRSANDCYNQQPIGKKYYSEKKTKNTPTEARVRGGDVYFSGSGFVETFSLIVNASSKILAAPMGTKLFYQQYDHLLSHTKSCMKLKLNAMQESGWVDERTRAVFVEYCVQPQSFAEKRAYIEAGACHRIIFAISPSGLVASIKQFSRHQFSKTKMATCKVKKQHILG